MANTNRVNANAWQAFVTNATQQITGVKNIISGSGVPTTATSLYPALYFDTATNIGYFNLTGAANAWQPLANSSGGGGISIATLLIYI